MDHYDRLPENLHHQLAPEMLHYNLQALPIRLQAELHQKEQAACETLRQMSIAYGYRLNDRQMQRSDELLSTMYRHLNAQAEVFVRFQGQGSPPIAYYWDDFRQGDAFFVVDRAAVFPDENEHPIEKQADFEHVANQLNPRRRFSEDVITARQQVVTLVRDLIDDLRNRPLLEEHQQQEADLDAIRQNKEEEMMVAATQFMATLPKMTLVVHRHIEAAFFNGY